MFFITRYQGVPIQLLRGIVIKSFHSVILDFAQILCLGVTSVYCDESVLLALLVVMARRLSLKRIADWLACYDGLTRTQSL